MLIGIDDVHHFLKAGAAQRRGDEGERGVLLRRRHVAELEAVALARADLHRDAGRQVGPDGFRRRVERKNDFGSLTIVEFRQEGFGSLHRLGGGARRSGTLFGGGAGNGKRREKHSEQPDR